MITLVDLTAELYREYIGERAVYDGRHGWIPNVAWASNCVAIAGIF
jgi:hypothetical protein